MAPKEDYPVGGRKEDKLGGSIPKDMEGGWEGQGRREMAALGDVRAGQREEIGSVHLYTPATRVTTVGTTCT
ncbi:hypothetical protein BDZ91DRAFT_462062 [Kalaharituber pfeilii]|nr:hypothetical protein BDZ91DRAFT_462062 [Kalaharituber pfeilii]